MVRLFGLMYAQVDHPCRALAKRVLRHMDELFLFVLYPDLPSDNNLAEGALRPLVVQRKISGGSSFQIWFSDLYAISQFVSDLVGSWFQPPSSMLAFIGLLSPLVFS